MNIFIHLSACHYNDNCNNMSELFFYVLDTKCWVLRKFSTSVIPMLFCGDQTCVQNLLTIPQASCCGEAFPKLVWLQNTLKHWQAIKQSSWDVMSIWIKMDNINDLTDELFVIRNNRIPFYMLVNKHYKIN